MSGSVTIPSNRSALCKYGAKNTNYSTGDTFEINSGYDRVLIGFDPSGIPAAARNKRITEIRLYAYGYELINVAGYPLRAAWNEATVCYANKPDEGKYFELYSELDFTNAGNWDHITTSAYYLKSILQLGLSLGKQFDISGHGQICNSRHATNAPYLVFDFVDESPTSGISSVSPSSGYIPKNKARTFRWNISQDGYCVDDVTVVSSKFRWKPAGGSETEVDCGTALSYTMPAASITADSIQWQCEVVDSLGTTVTSSWYTLSTVEALPTAAPVSPMETMVSGGEENVFSWSHRISTGTAPTGAELQYSTDGSTWTTLATVSGPELQTSIPANTLPAGDVLWRVRTYNTENAAGSWSSAASIFVVSAPPQPAVSVEQTPRPLISWQSSDQQGYQIRIPDAWESGSVYGTDTSSKCQVILPDGDYIVEVRVVNEYGLWSEWGSAPLNVANSAGTAITLTAQTDSAISLAWSAAGTYERFLVERDGEPVAVTTQTRFTDLTAVGTHSYRVLGIQTGSDDYGVSNTVSVTLTVESNSITDLETGERLELRYSTTQIQEERIRLERSVMVTHFTGADWPSAEVSRYRNKSTSFEAAFRDLDQAARLEAILGRLVCLKTKNGESVTGVVSALQKTSSAFWVDYTCTIEQVEVGGEVAL
jgi:hypothetical protein